ncbi:hypothetical protein F511_35406 [Dorcoceras hygrometricum]|uniref:Uncharacterized protein n=1 Tax=Dorcoceras hygrometricum TaxID=472368 RepID=A0A2Z7C105_9LAMI|nr:hypothetical protein F511_35406 [Dorcoceras hygrometricum]
METSKVESAVRNQARAKLNQLEHNKTAETMTISCKWFSIDDVIGDVITISRLREQSQESAGSLFIQTQERSDVVEEAIQSQATVHQQMLFGDSDSKTMSFTLVDTTAFCDSAEALCVDNQSQDPVASYSGSRRKQQQHPVESLYESAVATQPVASFAYSVDLIPRRKKRRSSEAVHSVARYRTSRKLQCFASSRKDPDARIEEVAKRSS